jgi:putative N6-adenine-specific DNA methylase
LGVDVLPLKREHAEPGLLECEIDTGTLYRLNFQLRTASRLLIRMGEFNAAAFSELRKKASRLPWASFLVPGRNIAVRVTTIASKLYHKKGIAERLVGAISDALGRESKLVAGDDESNSEFQLVVVRLIRDMCHVSIDSSGDHLYRRGYRKEIAKAPLRENIAAALLLASGWNTEVPLVDPFCGSGVIPIEAAMMAAGIPPGQGRNFAFEKWPLFDSATWATIRSEIKPVKISGFPEIMGSDRDAGAIKASRGNAERAGVEGMISWSCRSISDLQLPDTLGWIVTNPPYGERIKGGPDLRNLYSRMGSVWRDRASLWHIYMVNASPRWSGQMGMKFQTIAKFNNGGIPVALLKVDKS